MHTSFSPPLTAGDRVLYIGWTGMPYAVEKDLQPPAHIGYYNCLCSTGVWTQGLPHAVQAFYQQSHLPSLKKGDFSTYYKALKPVSYQQGYKQISQDWMCLVLWCPAAGIPVPAHFKTSLSDDWLMVIPKGLTITQAVSRPRHRNCSSYSTLCLFVSITWTSWIPKMITAKWSRETA